MAYIPKRSLRNLKKYSYQAVDKSAIAQYVLQPFWTWFVTLWPLSVAPNTITLAGLSIVMFNFITMLYYDPAYLTGKGGATALPQWLYFTWAIGLFLYQTFDAIDGKQARRTGMAGPLGEMFDHGCDALNTTLEAILASHALNLGRSWWTVASQIATLANFYLTTWEEYHTGQLYLGVFSGPVEGILMIIAIYIISGIYGPSFWDTGILTILKLDSVPMVTKLVPNFGLNELFMIFGGFGLAFNIMTSYMNVRNSQLAKKQSALRPLISLLPFPVAAVIQILWLIHPTYNDSDIINSPLFVPFLCAWGLQFAHQVGRIILAHVCRTQFPWFHTLWLWSVVGAVDTSLPWLLGRPPVIHSSPRNTAIFVYLTLAMSFVAYARFCILVIHDITSYLGIGCFTVSKKDSNGVWHTAENGTVPTMEKKKIDGKTL